MAWQSLGAQSSGVENVQACVGLKGAGPVEQRL
jgi:hypothetical protein